MPNPRNSTPPNPQPGNVCYSKWFVLITQLHRRRRVDLGLWLRQVRQVIWSGFLRNLIAVVAIWMEGYYQQPHFEME